MVRAAGLVVAVVALLPAPAYAGRSFYGWLFGTETMPERGVELQTWIYERDGQTPNTKETDLWWGPVVGVTDQLELAFPIQATSALDDDGNRQLALTAYGIDARYRLLANDADGDGVFAPLVRLAINRDVSARDAVNIEGDLLASYTSGRVQVLAQAGVYEEITSNQSYGSFNPGLGVSVRAGGDLRIGAEGYGELDFNDSAARWVGVGPNVSWTQGRFWISGSYLIGIYQINAAPRVVWGIAF